MVGTFHQYLEQLGQELEHYISPDHRSRVNPAIKQLQNMNAASTSNLITVAISEHNNLDVRWVACKLLLLINNVRGGDQLIPIIENANNPPELRIAATMSAGRSATAKGIQRLAKCVGHSEDLEVDLAIMYSLVYSVSDIAIYLYVSILQSNPDAKMREMAAYCLGQAGSNLALKPLTEALLNKSEDVSVRSKAAEALGMLSDPFTVDILIQILNDKSAEVGFGLRMRLGKLAIVELYQHSKRL